MQVSARPGPGDSLLDIKGLKVGQAEDARVRTGTTVILPDAPVAMGVDVRGGAPGTRDTDALDPTCLVEKVHGLVLSGGSVFGLAAADGVTAMLSSRGIGLPLGPRAVPVVPSAILFDLANGGDKDWGDTPPYRDLGIKALMAAGEPIRQGRAGAGYGALAGGQPGGIGTASLVLADGTAVAALIAVNCFGEVAPGAMQHGEVTLPKLGLVGGNTTIGCVATNAVLDKAACRRLAIMAQDGLARTIRPIHTSFDGDTIFAMATGEKAASGPLATTLAILGTLAADCVARAVEKAVSAAAG
ncbi:P1 family peptidase [Gimibacter soli]|uniref:P1 family peptidase n=1 Tax=Gimibacter soli TaxID=3024400 RepID=A0AAE9XQC4_9PROT|nr:P1 family peptidase [Gimibacter soli]WCL54292.1 P1 family peptidase [Gimibacter soli]